MVNIRFNRSKINGLALITIILMISGLLQGCLYPKELRKDNQAAVKDGILLVQNAVDEYQKLDGLLPLINADMETPEYEKFKVNLKELETAGLLSSIPQNAFENGGTDQYLILNEETNPTVRVMDLVTAQRANDLQRLMDLAKSKKGQAPRGDELYPGYYTIPLSDIGARDVTVKSPYSGEPLQFMMDEKGNIYVDYARDLMQAMERTADPAAAKELTDLREILVEVGLYSPIKSVPYIWRDNAPWPQTT
ncbi:hypothetical protein [Paenibacillus marinisediminis]